MLEFKIMNWDVFQILELVFYMFPGIPHPYLFLLFLPTSQHIQFSDSSSELSGFPLIPPQFCFQSWPLAIELKIWSVPCWVYLCMFTRTKGRMGQRVCME